MSSLRTVIVWFRRDLRLRDNAALHAAVESGAQILPVFIFDPALLRGERFSVARLDFMLDALRSLDESLRSHGGALLVRQGDPLVELPKLAAQVNAEAIYANRDYSPYAENRDRALLDSLNVQLHLYDDALLHAPEQVKTQDGRTYTVYTPFKRQWLTLPKPEPVETHIPAGRLVSLDGLNSQLIPTLAELGHVNRVPIPQASEQIAHNRLEAFLARDVFDYDDQRDQLLINPFEQHAPRWTSGLSPYLRFGLLSIREAYHAAIEARASARSSAARDSVDVWISELAWREFYMHILHRFPQVLNTSFRPEYEQVEYRHAPDELQAWQNGQTGYPIVDAAMRQLNAIGWMHNRARMIVASFLTKDLLIYWREGDVSFMQRLIDGDPAANNGGWQWSAGTGTDAQPYFRIFNPVAQSQKFDPDGAYIRHWVPELRDVPTQFIHAPWLMPVPPRGYPRPIVDHGFARERTLTAFKAVKAKPQEVSSTP